MAVSPRRWPLSLPFRKESGVRAGTSSFDLPIASLFSVFHLPEGTPLPVTRLDVSRTENSHRGLQFLPDGRRFLSPRGVHSAKITRCFLAHSIHPRRNEFWPSIRTRSICPRATARAVCWSIIGTAPLSRSLSIQTGR